MITRLQSLDIDRALDRVAAIAPAPVRAEVAVIIPCYNEETAIGGVVSAFRAALPAATVYVYDNNSADRTRQVARDAGALVRRAPLQGKGNVVRQMFSDVEADIYVMVDGDGTYEAAAAPRLIEALIEEGCDMVTGARISQAQEAYRPGHVLGNRLLTGLVRHAFGCRVRDMLSGYRVFSRRFVKSFPAASARFEIEAELTVHALQMRLPTREVDTAYGARPDGSTSKLSTIRDGLRILRMIGLLLREERPLQFFGACSAVSFLLAGAMGLPVIAEFWRTGLVLRFPTLIVAVGLGVTGLLSLACGLILDTVARARLEQRRFAYLSAPGAIHLRPVAPP
ncbi:glycosyltransferase [Phenylobacterium montanum]|uniref:Glycosyltransferase n=1 Tax=Phenylobacterium montanum TaxID=2823693 RepID=A0A975G0E5_9CAUL|nr:glycosyltransferase [Caulobacter sp. S6]QUD88489.1 glycosyltransferase [Caulobacter sp. S6]